MLALEVCFYHKPSLRVGVLGSRVQGWTWLHCGSIRLASGAALQFAAFPLPSKQLWQRVTLQPPCRSGSGRSGTQQASPEEL